MTAFADFLPYEDDNPVLLKLHEFGAPADLLPPSVPAFDWRNHGVSFNVRNQGDWNACTSFAFTGMIEARRKIAGKPALRLCAGYPHGCLMGIADPVTPVNISTIGSAVAAHGHASAISDGLPATAAMCTTLGHAPVQVPAGGFARVLGNAILDRLVSKGPMVVDMLVPANFPSLGTHDVWTMNATAEGRLHAMVLVGYDWPAKKVHLLNSMGAGWGNHGFLTVSPGTGQLLARFPYEVDPEPV